MPAEQLELLCVEQNDETNFPPEYIEAAAERVRGERSAAQWDEMLNEERPEYRPRVYGFGLLEGVR